MIDKPAKGLLVVLVVLAAVLAARTFASFASVAGTVGHTLTGRYDPADIQRGLSDGLHRLQALAGTLSPQAGHRGTISVLDVPSELERLARKQREQVSGGPLVLKAE